MLKTSIAFFLAGASVARAHPGHDAALQQGNIHWWTQIDHLAVMAVVVVVVGILVHRCIRSFREGAPGFRGRQP